MTARKAHGGPELEALESRLGHAFADRALLDQALTHVSAAAARANYQRLEFLGDRVLGLAVADLLTHAFPTAREGELSKRLAELVRRETCVEVARVWDVGPALRLGPGERQSGGADKAAILGDVAEAIIGAVYLDAGWDAARDLVARFWGERVARQPRRLADPKTELQEWAQARGLPPPTYRQVRRAGPEHEPIFVLAVEVPGFAACEGAPESSKKLAERSAAAAFLARERVGGRAPAVAGAAA
ncbi:MAG: ribonuclease III [Methylobacteriaceae bacterium]|nr:ribonuclease III [Methylobacteriaceae bacterium]